MNQLLSDAKCNRHEAGPWDLPWCCRHGLRPRIDLPLNVYVAGARPVSRLPGGGCAHYPIDLLKFAGVDMASPEPSRSMQADGI